MWEAESAKKMNREEEARSEGGSRCCVWEARSECGGGENEEDEHFIFFSLKMEAICGAGDNEEDEKKGNK